MPAPSGLRKAVINASLNEGEIMAHNIYYRDVSALASYDLQDHANQIKTAWMTALTVNNGGTSLQAGMHTTTRYTDVKLYEIDEVTGRTSDLAQSAFPVEAVGQATAALPNQIAVAVTLETGQPGRTKRGRFYLGGITSANVVAATGRLQPGNTLAYSRIIAQFLEQSRDQANTTDAFRAVVYSRVNQSTLPITRVSIGDVFDTQRRRRNGLVEARQGFDVNA
jgi:exosome complex RNA-binding protein Csl4